MSDPHAKKISALADAINQFGLRTEVIADRFRQSASSRFADSEAERWEDFFSAARRLRDDIAHLIDDEGDDEGDAREVADLPQRIVVGANGAYWRDFGEFYSMCPTSDDNEPVEVIAVYVRTHR